ncbi:hypothetical protein FRC07_013637 [Ceratobasidium sp. 392]|nr:hypothetical protein FRC07_013637 [Ceratobasidium sp. 392]
MEPPLLNEEEVLDALNHYIASAITRGNSVNPYGTSAGKLDGSIEGTALCLYYAALDSNRNAPSVQLPPSGWAPKSLQFSTCPPQFQSCFMRWAKLVPPIHDLAGEQKVDLERILCDLASLSLPAHSLLPSSYPLPDCSTIAPLHCIAGDLVSLAVDISRCRSYRASSNRTNTVSGPISAYSSPYRSASATPHYGRSSRYCLSSPESPPETTYPYVNTTSPHSSDSFSIRGAPRPSIIAHDSMNERDPFVGGFVQRGFSVPSPTVGLPAIQHQVGRPEPLPTPPSRSNTVGPVSYTPHREDDQTSLTDQIAAVISSSMAISDIITILCRNGCKNLSAQLNLAHCEPAPRKRGGCSDVYFGWLHDGTPVALKTVFRSGKNEEERKHLKRTARELYTWSKCRHRYIAPLLGLAEFRGQIAMVSPWMEKGDLRSYVNNSQNVDRLHLSIQIAEALAYLHSIGVVHGDLKGPNVLISRDEAVALIDFGNSVLGESLIQFTATSSDQYSTARWAAPEVADESKNSPAADVYALGMTILEIFTGKVPYSDKNDMAAIRAIAQGKLPIRPFADIPDVGWGNRLWELLLACWDRDPKKRPQANGAHEILRSLALDPFSSLSLHEEPSSYV